MSDSYKIYASQDWVNEKVPEGAGSNQQLVTNADGNANWVERTHWTDIKEDYLLPECELVIETNMGRIFQPPTSQFEVDKTYTVRWNGVDYEVVAGTYMYPINETDSVECIALGNRVSVGEANTGEPFAIMIFTPELMAAMGGAYAGAIILDGSTAVTLSIKGGIETVHQLDSKYLPTTLRGQKQIVIEHPSKDIYNTTFPFEEAYAMDEAELQNSIVIKDYATNGGLLWSHSVVEVTKFSNFPVIRFSYVAYDDGGPYKVDNFINWHSDGSFAKDDYTSGARFNMTVQDGSGFTLGSDTVDYLQNKFVLAPMTSTTIGGAIQGTTLKMTNMTLDVADNIPQINSASVGQTIVVKTVDENGRPTEWEAVDIVTEDRVNELINNALSAMLNAGKLDEIILA